MQKAICVDDFGSEVFKCRATGRLLFWPAYRVVGSLIPGVKSKEAVADTAEARLYLKLERKHFGEMEANCNTCSYLQRVSHSRCQAGFLQGICTKVDPFDSLMLRCEKGTLKFHPDDCMLMPCHNQRN